MKTKTINHFIKNRRLRFIMLCVWVALILTALWHSSAAQAAPARQPNFVLLIGDDLTYHDLSCYGSPNVQTPNIDSLAREGMRFTRAFTAASMCTPSRTMLYTGLFPVKNGAHPNGSSVKAGTKSIVHYLRDLGYRVVLNGKSHVKPADSFPFDEGKLDELLRADQPFCFIFASHNPHVPWTDGDASLFDPKKLELKPYILDTPETRKELCKYFAEVSALDREVGEVLDQLKKSGKQDNTLVLFFSEQGSIIPAGKWTCYDPGIQAGVLARWPGRIKPGSVCDEIVQYTDVVPTLIEAAGGKPSANLDGHSFLNLLEGRGVGHWQYVYALQTTRGIINAPQGGYAVRAIRDQRYKLILNLQHETTFTNFMTKEEAIWKSWLEAAAQGDAKAKKLVERYQHRPAVEFYDLQNDPWELENVADQPQHKERIEKMRRELFAWMMEQGDKGVETEQGDGKNRKDNKESGVKHDGP